MRKILSIILCVSIFFAFGSTVYADEAPHSVTQPLDIKGAVQVQRQNNNDGSIAYAVKSSYGDREDKDLVQYFVRYESNPTGFQRNPAFDFVHKGPDIRPKSNPDSLFNGSITKGDDARTPINLDKFGWIGASHGTAFAIIAKSPNHGLSYDSIGKIYTDTNKMTVTLARIIDENTLGFIPMTTGNEENPTFKNVIGLDLTCGSEKLTLQSITRFQQLWPSYVMKTQNVFAVNGTVKGEAITDNAVHICDYVQVEEEYVIKNPATVAKGLQDKVGTFTENPNLGEFGNDLMTFKLIYTYYPDGTMLNSWEHTFHKNVTVKKFGGIQWAIATVDNKKPDIYYPNTKEAEYVMESGPNQTVNFARPWGADKLFPKDSDLIADYYNDPDYIPDRRIDYYFDESNPTNSKAFAGGYLPIDDGENEIRKQNTKSAFNLYKSRKAYFHFLDSQYNTAYPNRENKTFKGTAYRRWIDNVCDTYSFYTIPFERGAQKQLYIYIDLFESGMQKKFDLSQLNRYSFSVINQNNLAETDGYKIENNILTVTAGDTTNSSSSLVICATDISKDLSISKVLSDVNNAVSGFQNNEKYTAILAFYDIDDKCIDVSFVGDDENGIDTNEKISWPDGATKVKAFIWNGTDKITPLIKKIEVAL